MVGGRIATGSSFFECTDELLERVGDGNLVGRVTVGQPYAAVQHEGGWRNFMGTYGPKEIQNHPRGGGPPPSKFLAKALEERGDEFLGRLAGEVLKGGLAREMASIQEDLCGEVYDRAPRKSNRLRRSASPAVYDDGVLVFSRPAAVGRISG